MKATSRSSTIEILETRIAPSTVDVVGGVLVFTAGPGETNTIDFRITPGGDYRISDGADPTITVAAQAFGYVSEGMGSGAVHGSTAVTGVIFNLGDGNDRLNVQGLADPLTVNGDAGNDTFVTNNFSTPPTLTANGAVSIDAESITISNCPIAGATTVTFKTDNLQVNQTVTASTSISILASTPGREFDLGTEVAARISLTAAETTKLIAPSILIGDANSGGIFSDAALNFGSAAVSLTVGAAATITQTGAGAITAGALAIDSANGSNIVLNGANNVSTFAARLTSPGAGVTFTDATGFSVATVGSITGISSAGGVVTLNAGAVTQASGASILTGSLSLLGAGPFTLNEPTNHITGFVAMTTNAISYTDVSGFTVGAGSVVTSNADVTLTTNLMGINGTINAGTGNVTIKPLGSAITIDVGGSDVFGTTLGLSATDFSRITAGTLFIGGAGTTAAVNVSDAVAPANIGEIYIQGGTVSGAGSIAVPELTLQTTGAVTLNGANDVNTLTLLAGSPIGASLFADADGFTLGNPFNVAGTQITTFDVGTATVTLPSAATFIVNINGTTPGSGYDQVVVNGTVNIAGTTLSVISGASAPAGTEFVIINNDGADAITGAFDGLDEGDAVPGFSPAATITYMGGDGNDVAIITADPLGSTPSANGKSITLTDVDGDMITITASKGTFTGSEVSGITTGPNNAGRFEKLTLGAGFAGANITITAKPSVNGGNGFVNLGFLDATGVDLGAVTIAGDVARVSAGTVGGDAKVPALKSLTVQSLGLLGESTLAGADRGFIGVETQGSLPKLTVKDDLRGSIDIGDAGSLGTATIGGSIFGSGKLSAVAGIGLVKVAGDIRAVGGTFTIISDTGAIGGLTVDGSIIGESAANRVQVTAFGQSATPTKDSDIAIKSVIVKGTVEHARISAGTAGSGNADADIGSITVGGDWLASSATAGVNEGPDSVIGTADDTTLTSTTRNEAEFHASIGSFTVKGQAFGTAGITTDMFGVVAEQIGKAKVGTRTFAFKADKGATLNHEAFFAAPTLTGAGAETPAFDFTIREIGSTTPTINATGPNLTLSTDNKTATFTDVDGDLVTVKRSLGTFSMGDFAITTAGVGGLLGSLTLTPETAGKAFDVTITAKVGPNGGNGFVNVGKIDADQTDLGKVTIGGELQDLDVGDSNATRIALGSLTVQSLGSVGGTSPQGDEINGKHGLGKITVKSDIRSTDIFSNQQDSGNLASLTVGGSVTKSTIQSAAGIGTIKIGGSFRDNGRIQAFNRVAAITIGGDLNDTAVDIFAKASITKGPDNAIGKFTIGGNFEKTNITIGENNNADAGIGAISVGHAWIASSIQASTTKGTDGFAGTGDDQRVSIGIDEPGRFSTIASLIIKGQALGTPASGDHFGIVAEQIGKAKIGTVTYAFKANTKESFAAAPTGPGMGASPFDTFDFYLREAGF